MENLPLKALAVSTGATLGVLFRVVLNNLFNEYNANITSKSGVLFTDLPANFCGCFILGVHESMKRRFAYPDWLNLAIATGFAGSVTTFASWHLQLTHMLVSGPRSLVFFAILIGVCMAFFGLALGRDMGDSLLHIFRRREEVDLMHQQRSKLHSENETNNSLTTIALLITFIGVYTGVIFGTIHDDSGFSTSSSRFFWMSSVFAPFGALMRWWLSRFNSKTERFPLGTFAANMTAMVLDLSIAAALVVNPNVALPTQFVLRAIITGLGGSLSTVSTWVNEASKLPRLWRYLYVVSTIFAALALGIVIYGTAVWVG
ncbi:unnamed protein product [Agarophyton chilense]